MSCTEKNTNKFILSKIQMTNKDSYLGLLPGCMWVYNGNILIHLDRTIYKFKMDNTDKYMYCFNGFMSNNNYNASGSSQYIYMFSLDYKEWNNYE